MYKCVCECAGAPRTQTYSECIVASIPLKHNIILACKQFGSKFICSLFLLLLLLLLLTSSSFIVVNFDIYFSHIFTVYTQLYTIKSYNVHPHHWLTPNIKWNSQFGIIHCMMTNILIHWCCRFCSHSFAQHVAIQTHLFSYLLCCYAIECYTFVFVFLTAF